MASKAANSTFLKNIVTRNYAAACPAPARNTTICTKVLPNKAFVAALDNGSPVARVTIAFKSGSRYEPAHELGLAHVLRVSAGLTTQNATTFAIIRNLQQMGASLTATSDREHIAYTLEATLDNFERAFQFLNYTVCQQEFRPWELSDNADRLKYEIASLPSQVRAMDLLHRAAFRRGLGNSLFISPRRIKEVSSECLQHFACNNLVTSKCAVGAVGIDIETAAQVASCLVLPLKGTETNCPSKYHSGELRKESGGCLAHVALALEGAAAGSEEALALAVAAQALGTGPAVKWGADNSALGAAGTGEPKAAAGFSVSYSDAGLYGVIVSLPGDNAHDAIKAIAGALRRGPSKDAINAAKKKIQLALLSEGDEYTTLSQSMAAQGLTSGCVKSPAELADAVEKLSVDAISQAHSKVANGKLSMGAAGNLHNIPYLDEL